MLVMSWGGSANFGKSASLGSLGWAQERRELNSWTGESVLTQAALEGDGSAPPVVVCSDRSLHKAVGTW